jgi:hypothetical protein
MSFWSGCGSPEPGSWTPLVDPRRTQALGLAPATPLTLSAPVRLADVADVTALSFDIGRMHERVSQRDGTAKGSNRTRRMIDVPGFGPAGAERLGGALAVPVSQLIAPCVLVVRLQTVDISQPNHRDSASISAGLTGILTAWASRTAGRAVLPAAAPVHRADGHMRPAWRRSPEPGKPPPTATADGRRKKSSRTSADPLK